MMLRQINIALNSTSASLHWYDQTIGSTSVQQPVRISTGVSRCEDALCFGMCREKGNIIHRPCYPLS